MEAFMGVAPSKGHELDERDRLLRWLSYFYRV